MFWIVITVHSIDKIKNQLPGCGELWNEDGTQVDKLSLSFEEVVSNHFASREVVKVKKLSSWNVSAKKCFVDVVSSFSCQPTQLRFTRKSRFWNRDLEKKEKVLSLPEGPVHCQNRTEAGQTHRYKAATDFHDELWKVLGRKWRLGNCNLLIFLSLSLAFWQIR